MGGAGGLGPVWTIKVSSLDVSHVTEGGCFHAVGAELVHPGVAPPAAGAAGGYKVKFT